MGDAVGHRKHREAELNSCWEPKLSPTALAVCFQEKKKFSLRVHRFWMLSKSFGSGFRCQGTESQTANEKRGPQKLNPNSTAVNITRGSRAPQQTAGGRTMDPCSPHKLFMVTLVYSQVWERRRSGWEKERWKKLACKLKSLFSNKTKQKQKNKNPFLQRKLLIQIPEPVSYNFLGSY